MPQKLIDSLRHVKGFDEKAFINIHASGDQVTSIRLNPAKALIVNGEYLPGRQAGSTENGLLPTVPWCPYGKYLPERPSFTFDPLFHAGVYYVQEASSMFLWYMLEKTVGKNTKGLRVLDLCAAPGGKTTLLSSYFIDGLIVANETIRSRSNILMENIAKWGNDNVIITNNDPKDFEKFENYFDVIVIDAPCSGSGLFRKDNAAIEEWSEENVMLCNARQERILADVFPVLKKEGILIYSTCSYAEQENEQVCDWIISACQLSTVNCQPENNWNIIETVSNKGAYGYRFYPYNLKGEGFFIAAFKKNDGDEVHHHSPPIDAASKNEIEIVRNWVKKDTELFFFKQNENILAIPEQWKEDAALIQKHLYLRRAGITVGALKHKDFIPHHELALSLHAGNEILRAVVNKEEAVRFLQKKELYFDHLPKGWALLSFENIPLGWIKILQNRVNNYYPAEWRILKD